MRFVDSSWVPCGANLPFMNQILKTRFSRLLPLFTPLLGLGFLAVGLIPVVSSDGLARSALSLSCLVAGVAFLLVDFFRHPERHRVRDYLPRKDLSLRALGFVVGGLFVFVIMVGFSFSTLTQYYGQRLQHDRLLETGQVAHAKVLKRCGWRNHGCLTIDFASESQRFQKSIPVDLKHYRLLTEGDDVTVVYPKGQTSAAIFTEFNFDRWKPQVPRSWGLVLFTLLAIAWLPLKRLLLMRRGFDIR
jgi:hypothetical protein